MSKFEIKVYENKAFSAIETKSETPALADGLILAFKLDGKSKR